MKDSYLTTKRGSIIPFLTQLLAIDPDAEPGNEMIWLTGDREAALIDLTSGRVVGHIWEVESGKYGSMLYVSLVRASRLWREHRIIIEGICLFPTFPRVLLGLFGVKSNSLKAAQNAIDRLLAMLD